jgi:hypothetical protein
MYYIVTGPIVNIMTKTVIMFNIMNQVVGFKGINKNA